MSSNKRLKEATRKMWVNTSVLRAAMEMYAAHRRAAGASDEVAVQVISEIDEFEKAWDEAHLPQENAVARVIRSPLTAPVKDSDIPSWMAGNPVEMD
jgi:hypothetical protein